MGDGTGKTELLSNASESRVPDDEGTQPAAGRVASSSGSSPNRVAALAPGLLLGDRFKVVRLVAQGGMGEVYEANDLALHTRVAIKTVRELGGEGAELIERLRHEVLLARQITHPNVCRIFDFHETHSSDGVSLTFLTMEFLEGETLHARLRRTGPMPRAQALGFLGQMAEGLTAIHAGGIVHRDLKPNNVMLVPGAKGLRPVVTDFGIARQEAPGASALTRDGFVIGTPDYMAPEQRNGEDASVRSDVYAFAVVAHEMVTGCLPAAGVAADAGHRWSRVLARGLAADPQRRFESPRALVSALRRSVPWARVLLVGAAVGLVLLAGLLRFSQPRKAGPDDSISGQQDVSGSLSLKNAALANLHGQGRALNQTLRSVEAIPVLQEVVRQQPSFVPAYLELREALASAGHWQESTRAVQEAVRRAAGLPEPVRRAAEILYWESVGDVERARSVAKSLHDLIPSDDAASLTYLRLLEPTPALTFTADLRTSHAAVTSDPRFDQLEAEAAIDDSQWERAVQALARSDTKTHGLDARFLQAKAEVIRARLALRQRRFGEAVTAMTSLEEFYRREGYPFDEAVAIYRKFIGLWMSGVRDTAMDEVFRSLDMMKPFGPTPELVRSVAISTMVFAVEGRGALARKALGYADGVPGVLIRRSPEFLFASAIVARENGDLAQAATMADAGIAFYTPTADTGWIAFKVNVFMEQDRLDELEEKIEEWVGRGRSELGEAERALITLVRSDVQLARHHPTEAAALVRSIPPKGRRPWETWILLTESEIALLQHRPKSGLHLANLALREATGGANVSTIRAARLQLARAYKAAGEGARGVSVLDALQADASREGSVPLELEVRFARWEDSPTGPSQHRRELNQLETDATARGFLAIARFAREAAAR